MDYRGRVEVALDEAQVRQYAATLREAGVRAVAVIDVRQPNIAECCKHLGVPTPAGR